MNYLFVVHASIITTKCTYPKSSYVAEYVCPFIYVLPMVTNSITVVGDIQLIIVLASLMIVPIRKTASWTNLALNVSS